MSKDLNFNINRYFRIKETQEDNSQIIISLERIVETLKKLIINFILIGNNR